MISNDERSKIVEYIKNHQKPNSPPISGRTGGCGDFVLSAIECATQRNVVNAEYIFRSGTDMKCIDGITYVNDYNNLLRLSPADILCIIHANTGVMKHYVLCLDNSSTLGCYVAGTSNGFNDYWRIGRNFPGGANFILTSITHVDFDNSGHFYYDDNDRIFSLSPNSQLIKIDYTLGN